MPPARFAHHGFLKPRPLGLTLLLTLLCACLRVEALAQPPSSPNVEIAVTNAADGRPVPNARILISRSGMNGSGIPLKDIMGMTDAGGRFVKEAVDLSADGRPSKVVVTADGFERSERELPPDVLRAAYGTKDRTLRIYMSLSELSAAPRLMPVAAVPAGSEGQAEPEPEGIGTHVYRVMM